MRVTARCVATLPLCFSPSKPAAARQTLSLASLWAPSRSTIVRRCYYVRVCPRAASRPLYVGVTIRRIAVYRALASMSASAKRQGQISLAALLVVSFVLVFLGAGSSHGFGSFGTDRLDLAKALYACGCRGWRVLLSSRDSPPCSCSDLSVVGYWTFAIVVESLVWLASVVWGCYALYKVTTVRRCLLCC